LVKTARNVGASAKFAGSGGAIIGTYEDEAMFTRLTAALEDLGCIVIKPCIEGFLPSNSRRIRSFPESSAYDSSDHS
jgi:glucuronokinase